ncbi:PRK06851 family protein [Paenibacillus sp. DS2015]|uniref:PRK06851 family protein n=1 Tax=Paenibacillus sp. DS2015 TaxID=3373917 RepID=UPI003D1EB456
MTGHINHFYVGGNTAHGFVSLMESSLQGLERLFILQGTSRTGKSDMIRTIGDHMVSNGHDIWFIHCASDNSSLDGMVIPLLKVGIIVGTDRYVIQSMLPEIAVEYVNLGEACDSTQLRNQQVTIDDLNRQISRAYQDAYAGFAEALRIHDEWEALYIANMDFQAADELTKEYIDVLYGDRKLQKQSRVDHRFLGAATPKGAVDFVPNLTEGLKRYLIKGRPGSGKSTILKKIAAVGIERGFDVEIYHCGFDSNSLDMIIVRDLEFAIFDSTAPHEYFPERVTDEIVDMYTRCIIPGTDEAHDEAIIHIKERYAARMKQSIQYLAEAKSLQDELDNIYAQSIDFSLVDRIRDEVQTDISCISAIAD